MEAVRAATGADAPRLLEMAQELRGRRHRPAGRLAPGRRRRRPPAVDGTAAGWTNCWPTEAALVVVGTLDEVVTGFGVCHVERGRRRGAAGHARRLLRRARGPGGGARAGCCWTPRSSWLEARGCRGVDGTALPGDREAKNFYESAGFKARLLTMHRRSTDAR